ncbi:hypothetical protein HN371_13685 [Candidatus Poribacteria bacterium]|jgi:neutral ceramidase|nr:hypothetical protein [Candidatus Poribacteria bacterium]MBT5534660.1 hypothetical protein [Candidatus Poribacteria bacterium]MBT5713347.1 hypothetical protein [Candidatus Poribacteria bacterium]MBT7804686.1 hypothetical protein [Candidatus Poribacteria bacterium]
MSSLRAGVASRDITPPVGVDLTGYGGRPSGCTSIHDQLHARALALSDGAVTVVLVSLDVLGISFELRDALRERALAAGIAAHALVLNASHTHAGPATQRLRGLGEPDDAYIRRFVDLTAEAIDTAVTAMEPASLDMTRVPARIGHNRREHRPDGRTVLGHNRVGAVVPHADVLRVQRADGAHLATWFAHACHPTTLGGDNLAVSAEFPGVAVRAVEQLEGGTALFAQGCCGDINPTQRGTFEAVEENGRALAAAVAGAGAVRRDEGDVTLASHIEVAELSLQAPPPREALDAQIAQFVADAAEGEGAGVDRGRQRMLDAAVEWATDVRAFAYSNPEPPRTLPFEIQAVRIGDAALVTLPGEVFADIGNRIEGASPFRQTTALGYTNGCHGYVPTAAAYAEGGYEVDNAIRYYGSLMFSPASEGELLAGAARALQAVAG